MVIALNNFDSTKDYFAVLGVHHDACDKTIKLAYRKMARRYHPDVSKIYNAVVKFQEVAEAFEVLTKHKESYCRTLKSRNTNPKKHTGAKNKNQHSQPGFSQGYFYKKPLRGKNRTVTYPLTLRYAIRLLKIGFFYIPSLKVKMKFTREAFLEKTFRIKGRGYPGLFGGENGDYHVKFNLTAISLSWELKGNDIYGEVKISPFLFKKGKTIELDSPSGIMSLKIPDNYQENDYVKVENMGLPADSKNLAGHLFTKLVEA